MDDSDENTLTSGGRDGGRAGPAPAGPPSARSQPRRFTRVHLSVVVGVLLVALVGAGWALLRARPVALATVTTSASQDPASESGASDPSAPVSDASRSSPTATPTSAPEIVVHVLGAVRKPGVVSLPARSRVEDAIEACGGLDDDADTARLNLAQLLADGQQVVIGTEDEPEGEVRDQQSGPRASPGPGGSTAGPTVLLDLNAATAAQLDELPGVGPVTAGKIIAWRDSHGRFSRVEELQEVDGIGPKTYADLAPLVRVD